MYCHVEHHRTLARNLLGLFSCTVAVAWDPLEPLEVSKLKAWLQGYQEHKQCQRLHFIIAASTCALQIKIDLRAQDHDLLTCSRSEMAGREIGHITLPIIPHDSVCC